MSGPVGKPVRLAVFGAGLIGRKHIAQIAAHPEAELVGLAEPDSVAAAAFPGVKVEAEARKLLEAVEPDAVIIASPNVFHADHGLLCAARGIPFLIEKPVTDSLQSAGELAAAVRKAGIATLVGHHRRHHPPIRTARRLIAEGAIGAMIGVSGVWATAKPEGYFAAGAWRKQPGGGPILINLIHEIDFLRFCLGEIAAVSGFASHRRRGFAVEDSGAVAIEFASGVLGTVLFSDAAVSPWTMEQALGEAVEFPFTGEGSYRFIGARGALECPNLRLWTQGAEPPSWTNPIGARLIYAGRIDPYAAQLAHFIDIVRGRADSLQTLEDGARTLAATIAVAEAAASGARVAPEDLAAAG